MLSKRNFPTPVTVIMIVIVLAAIATWIIPPGSYNRLLFERDHFIISGNTNASLPATQKAPDSLGIRVSLKKFQEGNIRKPVAIPGSYHSKEKNPQGPVSIIEALFKGMYDTADIIFFILIIGSFISIFYESGALAKGISYISTKMKGRENSLIIIFTFLFAFGGTSYGMAEETLAFYPLLIPVFLAAGFDLLMPVAVIYLGSSIGTMVAVSNPFSTIIASDVAGITWTTGTIGRVILFFICTLVTIIYLLQYAAKLRKDPSKSMVLKYDGNISSRFAAINLSEPKKIATRDRFVLILFGATFFMLIFGVVALG
jgi:uncharacterized ion transporter superfamily protein YfcC